MDAVHVAGAALLVALYMHASSEVTANTTQDLAKVKNRISMSMCSGSMCINLIAT